MVCPFLNVHVLVNGTTVYEIHWQYIPLSLKNSWFQPISVIEHLGSLSSDGQSSGHYRCDVLEHVSKQWFRTNDDCEPKEIHITNVSRQGYAILFRRKSE